MKKNKSHFSGKKTSKPQKESPQAEENSLPKLDSLDEENQGFGGWLRSDDGLENMKLFVIANSIVLLTTLVYPQLQTVFDIISETVYGTETEY
ncbi:uncharacterized protein LOC119834703 [Zerene cesonia]|uniref:uncharacterized protein LOC119834703 n=1 Tax=Zerene cesonia TaxID=33412 RepID=UPI0018E4E839|nr:uncharacterized protein LOC119834703 [Zerene cesonia]XP_038215085.1 uncharacterized protein LOC119834703 [Zerene cesonia]XP_038215086.1 uncharacterized protein LOC119834703 [Zerene cesonia]XP_038215087.1 uncharacterized protein LOC119834703 [Zerene cesonia]XP_038215088.1 uncharacterized protein LOC119834703 [Zerene cesonia]XP_038215089.1 uncharacterized protein LOC119834703 [Zerene cesonia]